MFFNEKTNKCREVFENWEKLFENWKRYLNEAGTYKRVLQQKKVSQQNPNWPKLAPEGVLQQIAKKKLCNENQIGQNLHQKEFRNEKKSSNKN